MIQPKIQISVKTAVGLIGICLILLFAFALRGATTDDSGSLHSQHAFRKLVISDTDGAANDFTVDLPPIYGFMKRIVIDSNGTDLSYKVYLKDENAISIFSKTDCNSATEPHSYIISGVDTAGNYYGGVPMAGIGTLEMADGDDASMDSIIISIYYDRFW